MDNIEISRQLLASLSQGDHEGAMAFVSDGFFCLEAESMPYAGTYRGKAGFLELMGKLFTTFNGFDLVDITGDGDAVILQVTIKHESMRGTFGMPLTELWYLRDGLLVEAIPCYFDPGKVQDFVAGDMPQVSDLAFHRAMEHGHGDKEKNIAMVTDVLKRAASGGWEGTIDHLHPDFHIVESEATPYGGVYRGEGAFPEIMRAVQATWKRLEFTIDRIIADDRRVFVIQTMKGNVGGSDLEMLIDEMWEMQDGKIHRVVPYYFDAKKLGDRARSSVDA